MSTAKSKPKPASNEATIGAWLYAFFRGKGFSDAQAKIGEAGALGNLKTESSFNPAAYNAGEGALGIAQWEGGRGPNGALGNYAAAHHLSASSLQAQLGYLGKELNGPYARTVTALHNAPTASAAAYDWATFFEGNAPASNPQREANANAIYGQIKAGKPLTGGPTSAVDLSATLPNGAAGFVPIPIVGPVIDGIGSVIGGAASAGTSIAADAIEHVIKDLVHPLVTFLVNAFLVVLGVVGVIIALVLIAHSDDTPNAAPSGPQEHESGAGATEAAEAA